MSNVIKLFPNTTAPAPRSYQVPTTGLKWRPRLKHYKNSTGTNTFNPETLEAWSYGWWCYLKKIEGSLVYNRARYSNTTSRHQRELRSLLQELNIKIDLSVNHPTGLQGIEKLKDL